MIVGVTGGSGALGRGTVERLLQAMPARDIVITTREPGRLADLERRGVAVRRADFGEPATLTAAFAGVDRLLLISTDAIGSRLEGHRAAIAAARAAEVRHIVYTSVPEPVAANPALVVADHSATEEALAESGASWTSLRNNLYAHLQFPALQQAANVGRLLTNTGDGRAAYISRDDCAAVAAAVLRDTSASVGPVNVAGEEALGAEDLADIAKQVSGREVVVEQVGDQVLDDLLRASGMPPAAAALVTSFGAATRAGFLERSSTIVEDLTGRDAEVFADLARKALVS